MLHFVPVLERRRETDRQTDRQRCEVETATFNQSVNKCRADWWIAGLIDRLID